MTREYRTFCDVEIHDVEVRAEGGEVPGVTLQCIRPGVVDDYGSLWNPKAFDESLTRRLPVLCWAHNWAEPLGPGISHETSRSGPRVTFNFSDFDAVPQARRAHAQVKDGTIRDCSVGFSDTKRREPSEKERAKHPGVREVIESATLDEVSLVLRGAVPGAKVLAVRTATGGTVDLDAVVEIAKRVDAGELTQGQGQAALDLLAETTGSEPGEEGEDVKVVFMEHEDELDL